MITESFNEGQTVRIEVSIKTGELGGNPFVFHAICLFIFLLTLYVWKILAYHSANIINKNAAR